MCEPGGSPRPAATAAVVTPSLPPGHDPQIRGCTARGAAPAGGECAGGGRVCGKGEGGALVDLDSKYLREANLQITYEYGELK